MVKLLKKAEFDILHFEKTRVQQVDYKGTTNEDGQRQNKNIKPDRVNILKPKMTERWRALR